MSRLTLMIIGLILGIILTVVFYPFLNPSVLSLSRVFEQKTVSSTSVNTGDYDRLLHLVKGFNSISQDLDINVSDLPNSSFSVQIVRVATIRVPDYAFDNVMTQIVRSITKQYRNYLGVEILENGDKIYRWKMQKSRTIFIRVKAIGEYKVLNVGVSQ